MHKNNRETIYKWIQSIITHDIPIVVGVSWWPDSMYLLYQLKTFWKENNYNNNNIHVICCNHNTREWLTEEITQVNSYSIWCRFHTASYVGTNFSETELRKWRHQQYIDLCHTVSSTILFLWHHLDDRIETTILNIERWCWLDGIYSFSLLEEHFIDNSIRIVRPLISITKEEIIKECNIKTIPYSIDPTNNDINISKRNKIRKIISENKHTNLYKSMQRLYDYIENSKDKKQDKKQETKYLNLSKWKRLINICAWERNKELLYQIFKDHGITINPRSPTLDQLSLQLWKSSNKITYQWLAIYTYKYWSVIFIIK